MILAFISIVRAIPLQNPTKKQIEISLFENSFQQETNFSSLFVPKYSFKINMNSRCNKKRPYKY